MIDKAIHFQNPASQIFPVPQNPFLQLFHIRLHDKTNFSHFTTSTRPAKGGTPSPKSAKESLNDYLSFFLRIWGRVGAVLESLSVMERPQLILASNSPRRRQ